MGAEEPQDAQEDMVRGFYGRTPFAAIRKNRPFSRGLLNGRQTQATYENR